MSSISMSPMAQFCPRTSFPLQLTIPRSYYLGHHASGLNSMKSMLIHIQLIVECRDYRVPLTSRNPLFEEALLGKERVVVYTKKDLGTSDSDSYGERIRQNIIRHWHWPEPTFFSDHNSNAGTKSLLEFMKNHAIKQQFITPSRVLVVGMPNVGKSSLLNSLRKLGIGKSKAASTGAQPGITRKISTAVRIIDRQKDRGFEGVYLLDTPGVFVPYTNDVESMLKLALVGSVKDTIISPVLLCDYLLFHLNKQPGDEKLYKEFCSPTNNVIEFLEAVCRKTGKLKKGNIPDIETAALWIIQRWRQGNLGKFALDEIEKDGLEKKIRENTVVSLNQAKKKDRIDRKERSKLKQSSPIGN